MTCPPPLRRSRGFTALELLVVGAVIAILAGLLLPARANAKTRSKTALGLERQRQLVLAWQLYNTANADRALASLTGGSRPAWIGGYMDFASPQSTNRQLIADGPLFKYGNESYAIYQCPGDRSTAERFYESPQLTPRIRSFSMSQVFDSGLWLPSPRYRVYAKSTDIVRPANTMVFVDEHPDSLNDGGFATAMVDPAATSGNIVDMPASHHLGAGTFSFADGHVDLHKWIGQAIQPEERYNNRIALNVPARDSLVDAKWISENTTVKQ